MNAFMKMRVERREYLHAVGAHLFALSIGCYTLKVWVWEKQGWQAPLQQLRNARMRLWKMIVMEQIPSHVIRGIDEALL